MDKVIKQTTTGKMVQGHGKSPADKLLFRVEYTANGTPTSGLALAANEDEVRDTYNRMNSREPLTVGNIYLEPA